MAALEPRIAVLQFAVYPLAIRNSLQTHLLTFFAVLECREPCLQDAIRVRLRADVNNAQIINNQCRRFLGV
jgi:hypothetical protein